MDVQRSKTSPQLPEEIIEEILLRAPVKTVVRFRCVSQQWRSLIGTKRFITQHLRNSQETPSFIFNLSLQGLQQCNPDSTFCEQIVECLLSNRGADQTFGYKIPSIGRRVFGCIDGMVCFLNRSGFLSFCNPSTRVTTTILPRIGHRIHSPGFGFDDSTGEFKVFVVVGPPILLYNRNAYRSNPISFFERKVYSSMSDSWKSLGNGILSSTDTSGVMVGDKLHWPRKIGEKQDIVSFDIKTEVFGEIELPLSLEEHPMGCLPLTLGVFGGSLSCLYGPSGVQVEVWVMEEYGMKESWTLVVNLQPPFSLSTPFCTGPMGEIVFVYGSAFLAYYPNGNVFRFLGRDKCFLGVYHYVESLVSPDYAWRQDAA